MIRPYNLHNNTLGKALSIRAAPFCV